MFVFDVAGMLISPRLPEGMLTALNALASQTDRRSFDDLGNWLHSAELHGQSGTPRLLVGDVSACVSSDEDGSGLPPSRVVSREEAMEFATNIGMKYIEGT
jgi:hypothetical protein